MGRDNLKTKHTIRAVELAEAVNAGLRAMRLVPGDYVPELVVPEGMSTGGGRRALQHLRLVPQRPNYPVLVVGWADQSRDRAELRTFEYVDTQHRERYKRPVDLDRAQYAEFLEATQNLFGVLRLKVEVTAVPTGQSMAPPSMGPPSPSMAPPSMAPSVRAPAGNAAVVPQGPTGGFLGWLGQSRGRLLALAATAVVGLVVLAIALVLSTRE